MMRFVASGESSKGSITLGRHDDVLYQTIGKVNYLSPRIGLALSSPEMCSGTGKADG